MTRNSSSLYEVRSSQGSTALPRTRLSLHRCLFLSCFSFAFSTAGFLLLMAARRFPEGNWDKLIYLVAGICFVNVICLAIWVLWDLDAGWDDIEANAAAAGAAETTTEARSSGSPDPAPHGSSDLEDRTTPIGHSQAPPRGSSRVPKTATGSFSNLSLSQASSSISPGSGGTGWVSRLRLQSRAVGSWMAKHLRSHGSRGAILPQAWAPPDRASPQAVRKPVPSPGRAPAGPRLLSGHASPRPQPSPALWSSMPTLSTAGCLPFLLPAHSHASPWLPQLLTGQSWQAALRYPPRAPVQGHPPSAQSPDLAWPGGPRPLEPPCLRPRPETTVPEPPPFVCRTTGEHTDAPVLHASSSKGGTVRKILVQPPTPGQVQEPQGPGSPGTMAQEPKVSDLPPVDY